MRTNGADFFHFEGRRARAGYRIVRGSAATRPDFIAPIGEPVTPPSQAVVLPVTPPADAIVFEPVIPPADLFRQFVELDGLDDAALVKFANAYGLLGLPVTRGIALPAKRRKAPRIERATLLRGESLQDWRNEIAAMRGVLETRRASEKPEAGKGLTDLPLDHLGFVQSEVNDRLRILAPLEMVMTGGALRLAHRVQTLRGLLWAQLAQALSGGMLVRACVCGRLIPLMPGARGAARTTCSGACRVRLHEARKAATKLRREGKSADQIAERLRVAPEMVRGWLESRRSVKPEGRAKSLRRKRI